MLTHQAHPELFFYGEHNNPAPQTVQLHNIDNDVQLLMFIDPDPDPNPHLATFNTGNVYYPVRYHTEGWTDGLTWMSCQQLSYLSKVASLVDNGTNRGIAGADV